MSGAWDRLLGVVIGPLAARRLRLGVLALFAHLLVDAGDAGAQAVGFQPPAGWTLSSGVVAPWAPAGAAVRKEGALTDHELRGSVLELEAGRIVSHPPLGCDDARYEFVVSPAEGMFQGAIKNDADAAVRALGVEHTPVLTMRATCDTGVFDYHRIASGKLLLALDNVVWTVENKTAPVSPEGVVLELLAAHMTGDMAFTPELTAAKKRFFTPALVTAIDAYFARPAPVDEPPVINGDPITNTQEYPTRFTLEPAAIEGSTATMTVVFRDGSRSRPVTALLAKAGGGWRIDDLRYEDDTTFRELLKSPE